MDTSLSYFNDRGEFKIAIIPESISDQTVVFDEEMEAYTYVHPIDKSSHLLHSLADRPALIEQGHGTDARQHWLWNGRLHRLRGPAFTCTGNEEWYAFGHILDERDFRRHQEFFLRMEAFAIANGIDLHALGKQKYFLDFSSDQHLIECANANVIPLCNRETGDITAYDLAELSEEVEVEERGPGLLMAAVLGAAAAFAAVKIKNKFDVAEEVQTAQQAQAVR